MSDSGTELTSANPPADQTLAAGDSSTRASPPSPSHLPPSLPQPTPLTIDTSILFQPPTATASSPKPPSPSRLPPAALPPSSSSADADSSKPVKRTHFEVDDPALLISPPLAGRPPRPGFSLSTATPTVTSTTTSARAVSPPEGSQSKRDSGKTYTAPTWHTVNTRRTAATSTPSSPSSKVPQPTLGQTAQDLRTLLRTFLVFIPSSLRRLRFLIPPPLLRLSRALLHHMARALHKRGALASSMFYDLMVMLWKTMINLFFREIRSRGAWKVPREGEGAVIFVVGPHHNQFLDPLLLMSEVRREAGRRISFLVAEASMHRKFIGQASKLMQSIPVTRAQDIAKPGTGTLTISPDDPLLVIGFGSSFRTEFAPKKQIMLSKSLGNATAEVVEVLDDGRLRIKKEFSKKATEGLRLKASEGVAFKVLPYVDQTRMYSSVYQKLQEGGSIGIFPEGGSHDRTDLLPLKAGVSIMALGALSANPALRLRIVPVGLSYFHPHRFRSRAVVEFGSPIEIPRAFVEDFEKGGEAKKSAIGGMMEVIVDGLKSVTVRAPDFETLMLIQATRRLYRPPGQHLTLGQIVELNKRFIAGYEVYKEEPKLKALTLRVKEYNTLLRYMGLKDHQIERVARPLWRSIILLCYRVGLFSAWGVLALPGVVLNAPIFIAAGYISRMKAKQALAASSVKIKGNDVLATWKVLVALAGAPALYSVYAGGATALAFRYNLPLKYKIYAPIATMAGLPLIGYSALKFGEVGMDVYKSLRPLFLSVVPGNEKQLDKLRTMRTSLQHDISEIVNEFGPQLFEDFKENRIIPPTANPAPLSPTMVRKRSTYGPHGQGTFLTHPMSWVDEYLFGWSQSQNPRTSSHDSDGASEGALPSGYVSGYTTDEAPDYDEVIHILSREQGAPETPAALSEAGSRYRRSNRSRSRSQLDLTALNAAVTQGKKKTRPAAGSGASTPTWSHGLEDVAEPEREGETATATATGVEEKGQAVKRVLGDTSEE